MVLVLQGDDALCLSNHPKRITMHDISSLLFLPNASVVKHLDATWGSLMDFTISTASWFFITWPMNRSKQTKIQVQEKEAFDKIGPIKRNTLPKLSPIAVIGSEKANLLLVTRHNYMTRHSYNILTDKLKPKFSSHAGPKIFFTVEMMLNFCSHNITLFSFQCHGTNLHTQQIWCLNCIGNSN